MFADTLVAWRNPTDCPSVVRDLGILLALVLLNGYFASAEIALLSVRKTRLRELADEGSNAARKALRLREQPERFLATVQVGVTVVGAAAAAFGGTTFDAPVAAWLGRHGVGRFAEELAFLGVVGFVSFLSIVLGELVPKSLALRAAERVALIVAPQIHAIAIVTRPLVWFLTVASNVVLRPFRDRTTFTEARLSREELQQLVEEAAMVGSIHARAGDIASRAMDLGTFRINALAVPRQRLATVALEATRDQVRVVLRDRPHSRYPVVGDNEEDVRGYVTARDLYDRLVEPGAFELRTCLRPVPFFHESMLAVEALRQLQAERLQIALVVDEIGAVTGLVTLEDIAEELLGEIVEEHETPRELIREDGDGFIVDAGAGIHEINRALDLGLEPGAASTLAGLVLAAAGHMPVRGEEVNLDDMVTAKVLEATPRLIRRVRLAIRRQVPSERKFPSKRP